MLREIRGKAAELRAKLLKARDTLVTDPGGARALMEQAEPGKVWELRTRATHDQRGRFRTRRSRRSTPPSAKYRACRASPRPPRTTSLRKQHGVLRSTTGTRSTRPGPPNDPIRMGWAEGKFKELATSPGVGRKVQAHPEAAPGRRGGRALGSESGGDRRRLGRRIGSACGRRRARNRGRGRRLHRYVGRPPREGSVRRRPAARLSPRTSRRSG